jgi:hypothetical protein
MQLMILALWLLLIALHHINGTSPLVIHNLSVLNLHLVHADGLAPWTQSIRVRGLVGSDCADSSVSLSIAGETGMLSIEHGGRGFAGVFRFVDAGMVTILYPLQHDIKEEEEEEDAALTLAVQENDVLFAVLPHVDDFPMGPLEMHSFMISAAFQNTADGLQSQFPLGDTRATVVVGTVGRRDLAMAGSRSYKVLYSREWAGEYSPICYDRPICCCGNCSAVCPPSEAFYNSVDLQEPSMHPLFSAHHSTHYERVPSPVWGLTSPSFNWPTTSPYAGFLQASNSLGSSFWTPMSSGGGGGGSRQDAATPLDMPSLQLPAGAATPATGVLHSPSSPLLYPSSADPVEQVLGEERQAKRRSVRLLSLQEYHLEQEYNAARQQQSPPVDMKSPKSVSAKRKSGRAVPPPPSAKRPRKDSGKK